jgi:hypothetical protein
MVTCALLVRGSQLVTYKSEDILLCICLHFVVHCTLHWTMTMQYFAVICIIHVGSMLVAWPAWPWTCMLLECSVILSSTANGDGTRLSTRSSWGSLAQSDNSESDFGVGDITELLENLCDINKDAYKKLSVRIQDYLAKAIPDSQPKEQQLLLSTPNARPNAHPPASSLILNPTPKYYSLSLSPTLSPSPNPNMYTSIKNLSMGKLVRLHQLGQD